MATINVRLSKFQREELSYKLDIMEEGFDNEGNVQEGYMAHHYGFATIDDLTAMRRKVEANPTAPSRIVELDEREARAAWGEYENAWDIASGNAAYNDPDGEYKSAAKRLLQAMERITEAAAAAGFDARKQAPEGSLRALLAERTAQ